MTIETLPFEHRPRNSIANNLDKINELVDWANQDSYLWASATGERVTVDVASSVKGLTVEGRSVQNGTPTPDTPIPVQVVEGPLSLVIGGASVAINLQGNTLASLPDGTRDELHIDSAGRVWVEKQVGHTTQAVTDGVTGTVGTDVLSSTGQIADGADVWYKLATAQTINLGYITPPAIPSGSVMTISASLTPTFHLEWWVDSGITDMIEDLKTYVDYRIGG